MLRSRVALAGFFACVCAAQIELSDFEVTLLRRYEERLAQDQQTTQQRRLGQYLGGGVEKVPQYWWTYVEPRAEDDVRVCNLDLWDGWKHSGNYSRLHTYFEICRNGLEQLKRDLAGRSGPVPYPAIWNFMCGVECPLSDQYHLEAMQYSGCSCDQLSTQPSSEYYSVEGDFCLENGARQLCSILGEECGSWDCPLGDFMCPSHNFRMHYFVGYGPGDCSAAAPSSAARALFVWVVPAAVSAASFAWVVWGWGW